MRKSLFAVAALAAFAVFAWFAAVRFRPPRAPSPAPPVAAPAPSPAPESGPAAFPAPTKTARCVRRGGMPDPACTPGATFPDATRERICTRGYAGSVRHVTQATKRRVFRMYGETPRGPGSYEVDHLVSLELGGSNDVANLWPEPAEPRPGFHEKDEVENWLHRQVCDGRMPLAEAQRRIAGDWYAVYLEIHRR